MDVLLVEPDAPLRDALAQALREARLRAVAVDSGEEALAVAREQAPPRVLVTAIALGAGMDGSELVRRLRGRWPGMAAVLTGERGGQLRGRVLGRTDRFLARPVTADALLAVLRGLTGAGLRPLS
ncbi:response regulator [Caldovatus aquaticus]|uniref:Response regulator n=1 Tax=Caldovatus aquaticus TaxID=2865671 RepID=A0ABS7EY40_9PROT|nr:response regulator [Caldovatus aquaticus]MBW8268193.1 response regulator [Caldovatus aquaticus]